MLLWQHSSQYMVDFATTQSCLVVMSVNKKNSFLNWLHLTGKDVLLLTEPLSGSDIAGGLATTAERVGDKWILNGEKRWIGGSDTADVVQYSLATLKMDA